MGSSSRKKERRHQRYVRNVTHDRTYKEEAWNSGKLIEENHNGQSYSTSYTEQLAERLMGILKDIYINSSGNNEKYTNEFRLYKRRLIDLILLWPDSVIKNRDYYFIKELLETYWDDPENLIKKGKV